MSGADPEVTLQILVAVQFFLGLLVSGVALWKLLEKKPPLHEVYATKKELDELQGKIKEADTSMSNLHKRINLVLRSVSRIEGKLGLPPTGGEEGL